LKDDVDSNEVTDQIKHLQSTHVQNGLDLDAGDFVAVCIQIECRRKIPPIDLNQL